MNPESINTHDGTDMPARSMPFDGIKTYLKLSGWLSLSAIGFLALHYLAMAHFGITPTDEGIWSLAAHIPREISVALLIAAVLNCVVERNTQLRHWHLESNVQEKLRRNAEEMERQARRNAETLNEEARQRAERLNEDVRKNVLRAVFLENLGPNVVHQIESKLFERRPYRVEANITYSLTLGRDARGVLRMLIEGNENYVSTLPVEELRLYVTHPPGFQVWATSMHPDEAELFSDTEVSKGWALWGLIPGQGLAFMWRRVQPCHQALQPSGTGGIDA